MAQERSSSRSTCSLDTAVVCAACFVGVGLLNHYNGESFELSFFVFRLAFVTRCYQPCLMVSEAASWAPSFSAFLRWISSPLTALNQGLNDGAVTFDPTFAASSHLGQVVRPH